MEDAGRGGRRLSGAGVPGPELLPGRGDSVDHPPEAIGLRFKKTHSVAIVLERALVAILTSDKGKFDR